MVMAADEVVGEDIPTDYPGLKLQRLKVLETEGDKRKCEYKLELEVDGKTTDSIYKDIEKASKKNANFPGFRKGQLPAFAKVQLKSFTLEQAINDSLLKAIDANELEVEEGDEGAKAEVLEDIEELQKTFKVGQPFSFTAEVIATETVPSAVDQLSDKVSAVVDVEVADEEK
eukprot:CAMPEP_0117750880 /NCGR_PEP_ID=MMETSP0947-20121206/10641_1 /TAXON_ID=44440 /ORGANISM="Chattonella subsalsa, Strain CCMP2191" /LENGTH=171 /DNA_ID=CAMNT_0005569151 /DNA_START=182 /DNA_END=697 /DNA_ORIENTATION=-